MTDDLGLALARIEALTRVTFPLGSSHKRFARSLAGRGAQSLSAQQVRHVARLAWRYRRQMPAHLVPPQNPDAGANTHAAGTPATQLPTARALGWPGAKPSAAPSTDPVPRPPK